MCINCLKSNNYKKILRVIWENCQMNPDTYMHNRFLAIVHNTLALHHPSHREYNVCVRCQWDCICQCLCIEKQALCAVGVQFLLRRSFCRPEKPPNLAPCCKIYMICYGDLHQEGGLVLLLNHTKMKINVWRKYYKN